jgi:hypothetical protein
VQGGHCGLGFLRQDSHYNLRRVPGLPKVGICPLGTGFSSSVFSLTVLGMVWGFGSGNIPICPRKKPSGAAPGVVAIRAGSSLLR